MIVHLREWKTIIKIGCQHKPALIITLIIQGILLLPLSFFFTSDRSTFLAEGNHSQAWRGTLLYLVHLLVFISSFNVRINKP